MTISNEGAISTEQKSFLERALSPFSVVKSGEGGTVILLTFNVFLLLGAYYFLKIVRETLILAESGAVAASYAAAGQALLLLLVVPAYGILASRVDRIRLVSWATLFFVSHLVVFFLVGSAGFRIGIAFYLWVWHLQCVRRRAILGVCKRHLFPGTGEAAVPDHLGWRLAGRLDRICRD